MNIPVDLKYTKTDEWVKVEKNIATIGITDFAQQQLSDIVFTEVKFSKGEDAKKGSALATIESVKAAADVNLPISGKVLDVNESISSSPDLINSDPYGKAWIAKLEISNPSEIAELMDAKAYDSFCQNRGH
jgi:glycine cleavage system H protein